MAFTINIMDGHSLKQGKFCWAIPSWIPPNEVFHGKTFVVPDI